MSNLYLQTKSNNQFLEFQIKLYISIKYWNIQKLNWLYLPMGDRAHFNSSDDQDEVLSECHQPRVLTKTQHTRHEREGSLPLGEGNWGLIFLWSKFFDNQKRKLAYLLTLNFMNMDCYHKNFICSITHDILWPTNFLTKTMIVLSKETKK